MFVKCAVENRPRSKSEEKWWFSDILFRRSLQKTDVTNELVEELQIKTKEFLQPNPTARAKMAAVKGISKLSGQAKSNTYPQAEGLLADCMLMYGKKLGENSIFGEWFACFSRDWFRFRRNVFIVQPFLWVFFCSLQPILSLRWERH